jgi:hypothetical protein
VKKRRSCEILEAKRVDLLKEIAHTDDLLRAREEMIERLLAQIPMTDDATR